MNGKNFSSGWKTFPGRKEAGPRGLGAGRSGKVGSGDYFLAGFFAGAFLAAGFLAGFLEVFFAGLSAGMS